MLSAQNKKHECNIRFVESAAVELVCLSRCVKLSSPVAVD